MHKDRFKTHAITRLYSEGWDRVFKTPKLTSTAPIRLQRATSDTFHPPTLSGGGPKP